MDITSVVIAFASLVVTTCSVFYEGRWFQTQHEDTEPCCNGTLGVVSNMSKIPCSAMKCCNKMETVAIFPVNYALGYKFRCLPVKNIPTKCYRDGQKVVSTNETTVVYEPRACCERHKFHIYINQDETALTIKCLLR